MRRKRKKIFQKQGRPELMGAIVVHSPHGDVHFYKVLVTQAARPNICSCCGKGEITRFIKLSAQQGSKKVLVFCIICIDCQKNALSRWNTMLKVIPGATTDSAHRFVSRAFNNAGLPMVEKRAQIEFEAE